VYLLGMLVKFGGVPINANYNASKILLTFAYVLLCGKFLNLLMVSEIIGAKLVMIKKMVNI
jgi:hypothetical protein